MMSAGMRKFIFFTLPFLLSSCMNLIPYTDTRPRVDPSTIERREQDRRNAEELRRSIPFTVIVRENCKGATYDPGEHRQWLGWRYGWRKVPNEIAVMCVTPDELRKVAEKSGGAECYP